MLTARCEYFPGIRDVTATLDGLGLRAALTVQWYATVEAWMKRWL
jgi:hypothetical protein